MDLTRSARIRVKRIAGRIFPKTELLLTAAYLVAGTLLFVYTEPYVAAFLGERPPEAQVSGSDLAAKGVAFVLATGVVLYLVLRQAYTGRRTAEFISRENAERFELVARAASDAMWDWDLRNNRVWRSDGYSDLFGYAAHRLEPNIESWMKCLHPEDQDRVMTGLRLSIRSGQQLWADEYRFQKRDGDYAYVADRAYVLRNDQDEAIRVIGGMTDITARRRAELELRQSRERLRALSARLQTLREEERIRISREIHDELGQLLTGVKMELRWMENRLSSGEWPPAANAILDRVVESTDLIDRVMVSVRRIATELRPDLLDSLGLLNAMRFELDRFAKQGGVEVDANLPEHLPHFPTEVRTEVFRILQEALTNVARHAQATRVRVALRLEGPLASLQIGDNGRGITPAELKGAGSLGLLGMQERARQLGGKLLVESPAGQGTTVTLEFPVPAVHESAPA